MEIISSDTSMIQLFQKFGISRRVSVNLLKTVRLWISSMGVEETVSRIKTLKAYFLTGKLPPTATWIALHSNGQPKGAFRPLWRYPCHKNVLNVLDIYTNYVSGTLTKNQWDKFYLSMVSREKPIDLTFKTDDNICKNIINPLKTYRGHLIESWKKASYDTLENWTSSPTKRVRGYNVMTRQYVSNVESRLPYDFHTGVLSGLIVTDDAFRKILYESLGTKVVDYHEPLVFPKTMVKPLVGSIAVIQERGYKARIVANPFRVYQVALSKLGNFLYSFLRFTPWDCTFDQEAGIAFVQQKLSEGKTVFCHDLSDATNHFPLGLQMFLLRKIRDLLPKDFRKVFWEHCRLFYFLSRGVWLTPQEGKKFTRSLFLQWTRGQPLGLYPSFALFTLTHGFVTRMLELECEASDTFRIVGDDIVISDPNVSKRYKSLLEVLEVPTSPNKSIVSSEFGEFAGKIITKDGPLRVEKWKRWSQKDIFSIFNWLGPRGESFVPKRYREMMREIVSLPSPLGLDINPSGLSLDQRLERFQPLVDKLWSPELLNYSRNREIRERRRDALIAFKHKGLPLTENPLPYRQVTIDPVEIDHINSFIRQTGLLPDDFKSLYDSLRAKVSGKQRGSNKIVTALKRFLPFFRSNS